MTVHLYPELTQFTQVCAKTDESLVRKMMDFVIQKSLKMTQVKGDGSRIAAAGEYTVRFGLEETRETLGFAEHRFVMMA